MIQATSKGFIVRSEGKPIKILQKLGRSGPRSRYSGAKGDLFHQLPEIHDQVKHLMTGQGKVYQDPQKKAWTVHHGPHNISTYGPAKYRSWSWSPRQGWTTESPIYPGVWDKAEPIPQVKHVMEQHLQDIQAKLFPQEQDYRPQEMIPEDFYQFSGRAKETPRRYTGYPQIPKSRPCPTCGQPSLFDGRLSTMLFYRCRSCGKVFNTVKGSTNGQEEERSGRRGHLSEEGRPVGG